MRSNKRFRITPPTFIKEGGKVYIRPTRMGGYLNGLIFLMFLLAVGYSNNLLLIFTLILFGMNLLWVIQTHFHLKQFQIDRLEIEDGHVGEPVGFIALWKFLPNGPKKISLKLECDKATTKLRVLDQNDHETKGEAVWHQRGVLNWKYLLISSDRPFGLYRTFRYLKVQGVTHVYPAISAGYLTAPLKGAGLEGDVMTHLNGSGDFKDLFPYSGHESRKISWKHYARTSELFIKEGEDLKSPLAEFEWKPVEGMDKEKSLSDLATQMVFCYRGSIPFTFELAGAKRGPCTSIRDLRLCLRDLSLC
jgi:uncharacterized protein (DUF58 family)